jgi:hypothetical protein
MKLHFGRGNAKLDRLEKFVGPVFTFSLLSGHTCPYAKDCQSRAIVGENGSRHIQDGPDTLFRCFSASQEVLFTNVFKARQENTNFVIGSLTDGGTLGGSTRLAAELLAAMPAKAKVVRIHVGGDFMRQDYFDAWLAVAKSDQSRIYYAYTKALPFWVKRIGEIPENFILTASFGGHRDDLIVKHNLRYTKVVNSRYAARKLGLVVDHDDTHAALPKHRGTSFALLLHGIQPKGHKRPKYGYTK